jgi:putative membrane-bound dehydrogenase-like protein
MRSVVRLMFVGFVLTSAVQCRADEQGLSPDESLKKMSLPAGFSASVVAAEPLVRQPVAIEFDDRGRLWVIQYLQYPNPEGLTRVSVDRFSRTKYDRVPEPPPHGPKGADRITILEDTDGDGRMDTEKDFASGLNLTSGLAFGYGGVFVLNVPYLLFYPDHDRDDIPDSDPEVCLTGFGMEDAHSVANSLMFGPDGWLYGCQGSTVTANIRSVEFQQGVWRYHPVTKEFELFCEGGGNSWGLDFDRTGHLLYSTNYGGHTLLHGVQGGYFIKSFGKHGALHNPHAYGYFDHAPHQNFRGGHVTVGGIIYQGDLMPTLRGNYVAGDLLGHGVYWHDIQPFGSTMKTQHGGELLTSADTWFAPTDVTMGPDGAIYVTDWNDARTAHPDPDADWDRSNGRIFRIAPTESKAAAVTDFATQSLQQLTELHRHPSQWFVRRTRLELIRRFRSPRAGPSDTELNEMRTHFTQSARSSSDETEALEALWTLAVLDGFNEDVARQLIESPHAAVRSWTVRLLGDRRLLSDEMAHRMDEFAEQEPDVSVRQQLACSAARFPAHQAVPMINANINRDLDHDDPYMPLLWWWAVEKHSVSGREDVMKRFVRPSLWKSHLGRDVLLTRLIRRYAAENSADGLSCVVRLLKAAPDEASRKHLWPHVLLGWQERPGPTSRESDTLLATNDAKELFSMLRTDWAADQKNLPLLKLGAILQQQDTIDFVAGLAFDPKQPSPHRAEWLQILALVPRLDWADSAFQVLEKETETIVRSASLNLLAQLEDSDVISRLVQLLKNQPDAALASAIRDVLLTRSSSARIWLTAVDRGEISPASATIEQVRRIALLQDSELDALVTKHWGRLQGASREEKLAEVRRLNNDVRAAAGNPAAGKLLFRKHCAACHQLFGEGTKVGPDLTTANRQDRDFLLISLVDPSSVIRKEFVSVVVQTKSGRVLTGLPIERTEAGMTLADSKGEKQSIAVSDIEDFEDSQVSLMPDNLYLQLKPQELRDLFAWLQRP